MSRTFGSLFSGIGGFDLGLECAGWECKWQVEIDPWRQRILARHWPAVPRWADVREFCRNGSELVSGWRKADVEAIRRGQAEPIQLSVDLICGGFPCQDLSVAGRRAGLAGERSGLFFEFARIAQTLRPTWLLIENVPGLLTSAKGHDFAVVVDTLAELGYGVAWRILDSQYFGVPQRRRRVYIVGHLGAPCPPEILFEPEGGARDSPAGRKAGEELAGTLGGGAGGRGWCQDTERATFVLESRSRSGEPRTFNRPNLRASYGDGKGGQRVPFVAQPLRSNRWGGSDSHGDEGNVVIHGRSNKPRQFPGDPHGGGSLGIKIDRSSYALDGGSQYVGAPSDTDGVREATGVPRWVDSCSRCADGRRYAALGDAVTVNVVEWIGRRIACAGRLGDSPWRGSVWLKAES